MCYNFQIDKGGDMILKNKLMKLIFKATKTRKIHMKKILKKVKSI